MYFGSRKIRSAGRNSGSIEVTLPPQLQELEDVECHLMVRDGTRPEIVLQPDLSATQALFEELWQRLRQGLGEVDDIGSFSPADFTLALFPPRHWQERPPLAYVDALILLHQRTKSTNNVREALTRLLAFMTVAAGYRLKLHNTFALAFGDAVAYLMTGISAGLGTDFERGMAHRIFWGINAPSQQLGFGLDAQVWQQARPGLRRVYEQFQHWQDNPTAYTVAQDHWYKALAVEMGTRISTIV